MRKPEENIEKRERERKKNFNFNLNLKIAHEHDLSCLTTLFHSNPWKLGNQSITKFPFSPPVKIPRASPYIFSHTSSWLPRVNPAPKCLPKNIKFPYLAPKKRVGVYRVSLPFCESASDKVAGKFAWDRKEHVRFLTVPRFYDGDEIYS